MALFRRVPAIDVEDLHRRRGAGEAIALLDIREAWEQALARFEDSIDLPLETLPQRAAELPRDRPLVVICHHGMRSARATQWLRANGFENAVNLEGGIDAWARRIDPAMRTY
jgi:rhodanese-related sulfurtransferase